MSKTQCADCGKPIISAVKGRKKYCKPCARKRRIAWMKEYRKKGCVEGEHRKREWVKMTMAKCPLCGKEHRIGIEWTGRGQLKKYCHGCEVSKVQSEDMQIYPLYMR